MLTLSKALCAAVAICVSTTSFAEEALLTITGDVAASGSDKTWSFDLPALEALPAVTVQTTTIWTEGPQKFDGVSLDVLMEHVGAETGTIRAVALNDYAVEIPITDAVEDGPIVAYRRDGKEMSVRDKGPLWIIYPYDDNEAYKSEEIYARSIWQLNRLEVVAE